MGDFRQDGGKRFGGDHGGEFGRRDGGRPNFPRKSWGGSGGRDRGPVTMHQAVCNQCGKSCEVPFRPSGDKPVYCNICFGGKKETRFQDKRIFNDKAVNQYQEQFDMLNAKLDRIIKALTPVVPVKEEKKEVIINKFMAKGNNSRKKETKKPKKDKKK